MTVTRTHLAAADRVTCPTCLGRRYLDADTRAIHAGARCGKDITLRFECETCHGRGFLRCGRCRDTGEVAVADCEGQYDGMEPCDCDAGKRIVAATPATPYVAGAPF